MSGGATTTRSEPRRSGSSLERKLPLLISGLLLAVIGAYCWASYHEVRQSSVAAARERLRGAAFQLADISTLSTQRAEAALRAIAADRAVVAAIAGGSADSAAAVLRRSRTPADSTLVGWELWTVGGVRRLALGDGTSERDVAELRDAALGGGTSGSVSDSARRSPFYAQGDHVFTWTVVPVHAEGRLVGYLAQRRRMANNPSVERQIEALTGENVQLLFANADGSLWTNLRGRPLSPPNGVRPVATLAELVGPDGNRVLSAGAAVRGTPWSIVLLMPEDAVFARPHALLRRLLLIGAVLVIGGAVAAWMLSRHVTRPLRTVTDAAEALAAGDFDRRVAIDRRDELGRLGSTFNVMAQRIGDSRDETLRAVRRTERLQAVTAALGGALDFDEVASVVLKQGLASVEARAGAIYLATDRNELDLLRSEGYLAETVGRYDTIPFGERLPIAAAARTGQPVYIGTRDEAATQFVDVRGRDDLVNGAWAALPLIVRDRVIGAIGLSFAGPREFDRETRSFLLALAQQTAQALDRATLFEAAVHARNAAEDARRTAQTANEAKSAFLAMMSHELRTPLNAIGGYADLLEMGLRGPVTEQQADDLARIRRNQQHLLSIINDILNLSRIEAGQLPLHITDVSPEVVLTEVEALIAPQVAAKGLRYELVPPAPGVTVRADREKLQQVLLNLVSNAVRFTDAGGTITVSCEPTSESMVFRVRDSGIGIPPDKHDAIFEPFVQVDSGLTRRAGGTGLGLAISRDLATAMSGRIVVESTPGQGSTFSLILPRGAPAPQRGTPDQAMARR